MKQSNINQVSHPKLCYRAAWGGLCWAGPGRAHGAHQQRVWGCISKQGIPLSCRAHPTPCNHLSSPLAGSSCRSESFRHPQSLEASAKLRVTSGRRSAPSVFVHGWFESRSLPCAPSGAGGCSHHRAAASQAPGPLPQVVFVTVLPTRVQARVTLLACSLAASLRIRDPLHRGNSRN